MTDLDPELRRLLAPLREPSDVNPPVSDGGLSREARQRIVARMRDQVRTVPRERRRARLVRRFRVGAALGASLVACGALMFALRGAPVMEGGNAIHLAAAGASPLSWTDREGVAREVRGELDLLGDGELQVPEHATALLTTANGVRIEAEKHTRVRVRRHGQGHGGKAGAGSQALLLDHGAVRCRVPPLGKGQEFEVATSTARVIVHGTDFSVALGASEVARPGTPCVRVREGLVEVQTTGSASAWIGPGSEWGCAAPRVDAQGLHAASVRGALPGTSEAALGTAQPASLTGPSGAHALARENTASLHGKRVRHTRRHRKHRAVSQTESTFATAASISVATSTLPVENRLLADALRAERSGDTATARALFQKLVTRYPQSPLAPEASAGLARTTSSSKNEAD